MLSLTVSQWAAPLVALNSLSWTTLPDQTHSNVNLHPIESQIVRMTNLERKRTGLPPLVIDKRLVRSTRTHAAWMTRRRALLHTRLAVAENIAMGQGTAAEVVRDWMRSPGHRANILNRSFTRMGAAAYVTPQGTIYWCQQFLP